MSNHQRTPSGTQKRPPALTGVEATRVSGKLSSVAPRIPGLDQRTLAAYRPRAKYLTRRIIRRVHREVDGLSAPEFLPVIEEAVTGAVTHFIGYLDGNPTPIEDLRHAYRQIGQIEAEARRSFDFIRAAHMIALEEIRAEILDFARYQRLQAPTLAHLNSIIADFQTKLLHDSSSGYMETRERRRQDGTEARERLLTLLTSSEPSANLQQLIEESQCQLTTHVAVAATTPSDEATSLATGESGLLFGEVDDTLVLIGDEPLLHGTVKAIADATGTPIAVSWEVPLSTVPYAWRWAERALRLTHDGAIAEPEDHIVWCGGYRTQLVLQADPSLRLDDDKDLLAPLLSKPVKKRLDCAHVLVAWLPTRASAPELSHVLGTHPQTVRNRIRILKELYGKRLDDPDLVLDLYAAVQCAIPRWERDLKCAS